jgi:transitional endoplasmic reticulum ATPase
MATVDTMTRRLQVSNLPPADSGRGVARLPVKLMQEMGLNEGDVIEIVGKRSTAARALRPFGEDQGLDIIRLDGLQRANAGVGSGDYVEVQKAISKPATRVVSAPTQNNVRLQASADALQRSYQARPLGEGETARKKGRTFPPGLKSSGEDASKGPIFIALHNLLRKCKNSDSTNSGDNPASMC